MNFSSLEKVGRADGSDKLSAFRGCDYAQRPDAPGPPSLAGRRFYPNSARRAEWFAPAQAPEPDAVAGGLGDGFGIGRQLVAAGQGVSLRTAENSVQAQPGCRSSVWVKRIR